MTLQPHTINLNPPSLQLLDKLQRSRRLRPRTLNIIIVVIELNIQPILLHNPLRRRERHGNILSANRIIPDITLIRSGRTIRECLIDHVPGVAAVAEVLDKLGDVILEDAGEGFVCPGDGRVGKPVRELGLPD